MKKFASVVLWSVLAIGFCVLPYIASLTPLAQVEYEPEPDILDYPTEDEYEQAWWDWYYNQQWSENDQPQEYEDSWWELYYAEDPAAEPDPLP